MKKDDFPEITPEEMPKFLNDVAEKFKDEEGQKTMLKLAQCSFYIHLINSRKEEIILCKDCKHRDPEDHKCDCGHDINWQLPREDNWFCADGQPR